MLLFNILSLFAITIAQAASLSGNLVQSQCHGRKIIAPPGYGAGNRVRVDKKALSGTGFKHTFERNIQGMVSTSKLDASHLAAVHVSVLYGSVTLAFYMSSSKKTPADTPPLWTFTVTSNAPQCVTMPQGALDSGASWFTLQTHY